MNKLDARKSFCFIDYALSCARVGIPCGPQGMVPVQFLDGWEAGWERGQAEATELRLDREALASAIAIAAKQAGIYNGEVSLTGPMVLMLLNDLVASRTAAVAKVAELEVTLNESDRRLGKAIRELDDANDTIHAWRSCRDQQKADAGYPSSVPFDIVWDAALAALKREQEKAK